MARSSKSERAVSRSATAKTRFPKQGQAESSALAGAGSDHHEQPADAPEASPTCRQGACPDALGELRVGPNEHVLPFSAPRSTRSVPSSFADLWCDDRALQGAAFHHVLELTSQQVDWVYDVWDEVLERLADKNNRNRSIAAQVLCNLAKSDRSQRMLRDFPALFNVVTDERFVTARHALQAMWKVGCVGKSNQDLLIAALENRFSDCVTHKNCTLIRYDIIECLRKLFDVVRTEEIRTRAEALIELESDPKYKKKYMTLWPNK